MAAGIDPLGKTADGDDPAGGKIGGDLPGRSAAVFGAAAGPHDGDGQDLIDIFPISGHIQHGGRAVNMTQTVGIKVVLRRKDTDFILFTKGEDRADVRFGGFGNPAAFFLLHAMLAQQPFFGVKQQGGRVPFFQRLGCAHRTKAVYLLETDPICDRHGAPLLFFNYSGRLPRPESSHIHSAAATAAFSDSAAPCIGI